MKIIVVLKVCKRIERHLYSDSFGLYVRHSGNLLSVAKKEDGTYKDIPTPYNTYLNRFHDEDNLVTL